MDCRIFAEMLLDTFDGHRLSVIGRAMRGGSLTGCFDDLLQQLASTAGFDDLLPRSPKPMLHQFNS